MSKTDRPLNDCRGFSLIEMVIGMAVLALGMMTIGWTMEYSDRWNRTLGSNQARDELTQAGATFTPSAGDGYWSS